MPNKTPRRPILNVISFPKPEPKPALSPVQAVLSPVQVELVREIIAGREKELTELQGMIAHYRKMLGERVEDTPPIETPAKAERLTSALFDDFLAAKTRQGEDGRAD